MCYSSLEAMIKAVTKAAIIMVTAFGKSDNNNNNNNDDDDDKWLLLIEFTPCSFDKWFVLMLKNIKMFSQDLKVECTFK